MNCRASVVLPEPGTPSIRYARFLRKPPTRTSSRPETPVLMTLSRFFPMPDIRLLLLFTQHANHGRQAHRGRVRGFSRLSKIGAEFVSQVTMERCRAGSNMK